MSKLSIVVPAYNEAANLPVLYESLRKTLSALSMDWECIIVDDHSSDQEASEPNGVKWKFGAAEAANREFRRRGLQSHARWEHGMSSQRESSLWRSPEETRSWYSGCLRMNLET